MNTLTFVENSQDLENYYKGLSDISLIKTDTNNSHYYQAKTKCPRCNGTGAYWGYGVCYKCYGSGVSSVNFKVITLQHDLKLKEANRKRIEKRRQEYLKSIPNRNKDFCKARGFNEQGEGWLILGNTFPIKEELSKIGAKFQNYTDWIIDHPITEYPCEQVSVQDLYMSDDDGLFYIKLKNPTLTSEIQDKYLKLQNAHYEFYECPQMRISHKKVKLISQSHYDTMYGTTYIFTMADNENHAFVWKTTNDIKYYLNGELYYPHIEDEFYISSATIKEHSVYKGMKQNIILRPKFFSA